MSLQSSRGDCRDQGRCGGGDSRWCLSDSRRRLGETGPLGDGGGTIPVGAKEAAAGVGLGRRLWRHGCGGDGGLGGVADVGGARLPSSPAAQFTLRKLNCHFYCTLKNGTSSGKANSFFNSTSFDLILRNVVTLHTYEPLGL